MKPIAMFMSHMSCWEYWHVSSTFQVSPFHVYIDRSFAIIEGASNCSLFCQYIYIGKLRRSLSAYQSLSAYSAGHLVSDRNITIASYHTYRTIYEFTY